MPRNSKPKFDAHPDILLDAVPKNVAPVSSDSRNVTILEQRKKQAEEPIYLNRM